MALIRVKVFNIYLEARKRIINEILSPEQRKRVNESVAAAQAKNASEAANGKKASATYKK